MNEQWAATCEGMNQEKASALSDVVGEIWGTRLSPIRIPPPAELAALERDAARYRATKHAWGLGRNLAPNNSGVVYSDWYLDDRVDEYMKSHAYTSHTTDAAMEGGE